MRSKPLAFFAIAGLVAVAAASDAQQNPPPVQRPHERCLAQCDRLAVTCHTMHRTPVTPQPPTPVQCATFDSRCRQSCDLRFPEPGASILPVREPAPVPVPPGH